jgi:hypothetical protein
MRRTKYAFAVLLVLLLGVSVEGCASAGNVSAGQGAAAALRVENHNFNDVDVFAVPPGGVPQRLGIVTGASSGTFVLPRTLIATLPVRIIAVPIGGFGAAGSGPLTIYAGQTVVFTVEADLHLSSAVVR